MGKNITLAAGWILALVFGGLLYTELQTVRALKDKLDTAQATVASMKDSAARMLSLEEKCKALEDTVAKLKAASQKGIEAAAALKEKVAVPEGFDPQALLKNMLGGDKAEPGGAAGDGDKKSKNPFAAMFEGEEGEKLMESVLPMQVDMQYSALYGELNLPEDRKAALRQVLLDQARSGAAMGMAIMRGEEPGEAAMSQTKEALRAAVAEVLTPEEMEQFDEYQEGLPERMMRQQYEMQLNMMAGDLPAEVKERTVDVLVENLMETQNFTNGTTPDFDAMRAAFDNVIVQLDQELSPEDAARVRPIIEQQRAGIDMAARMFGRDAEGETPAEPR